MTTEKRIERRRYREREPHPDEVLATPDGLFVEEQSPVLHPENHVLDQSSTIEVGQQVRMWKAVRTLEVKQRKALDALAGICVDGQARGM